MTDIEVIVAEGIGADRSIAKRRSLVRCRQRTICARHSVISVRGAVG